MLGGGDKVPFLFLLVRVAGTLSCGNDLVFLDRDRGLDEEASSSPTTDTSSFFLDFLTRLFGTSESIDTKVHCIRLAQLYFSKPTFGAHIIRWLTW
jgi:hypothetical protein